MKHIEFNWTLTFNGVDRSELASRLRGTEFVEDVYQNSIPLHDEDPDSDFVCTVNVESLDDVFAVLEQTKGIKSCWGTALSCRFKDGAMNGSAALTGMIIAGYESSYMPQSCCVSYSSLGASKEISDSIRDAKSALQRVLDSVVKAKLDGSE